MKSSARLALFGGIIAVAAIAIVAASLSPAISSNLTPPPTNVVDANNQFALDLYSTLRAGNSTNIFFSPTSVSVAFAMIFEGARGNTADEMRDAFHLPQDDAERRSSFSTMLDYYNAETSAYELQIANGLWIAEGFQPHEDYVSAVEDHYDSEVDTVDFLSDGVDQINNWVKDKTNGKIEKILSDDVATSDTKMAVTNAIYFKGFWTERFDKDKTVMGNFHVDEETTVQVPMMELTAHHNFAINDETRIVELPYEGERLSMLVLLPNQVGGLESLENELSTEKLNEWTGQMREVNTRVQMPKFQLETEYDLIPLLQELGVRDAFGNADFSGISDSGLFVGEARHKTFVAVDEEGTEAAAATGGAMLTSGPASFTADHPFIFIIQDTDTGQILFMGRVIDPTE